MFSPDASVTVGPEVGIGEFWAAG